MRRSPVSGYAQQTGAGQAAAGAFDRSRQLFGQVVAGLADPGCGELTHAQLEDRLTERSRELMRSLFQDHLDVRASREQRLPEGVPGAEGVVLVRAERVNRLELAGESVRAVVEALVVAAPGWLPTVIDVQDWARRREGPRRGHDRVDPPDAGSPGPAA